MSMSSIHVFDGGVIPGSGGSSEGANVKNLIMRDFDLTIEGQTVHSKILCDYDSPRPTVPYYSPVNIRDMAQWTKDGFNIQVRLESEPRFAASLGFLARVTIEQASSENEVTDAKVLTYERLNSNRIRFSILNFAKAIDETIPIAYLKLSTTDEFTLDSSVNATVADILTKIPNTASSTNQLVTDQQLKNTVCVSVIKWSDVLAAEDKSVFEARIQADISAGIEPVLLIDTDRVPRIAILSTKNTYVDGQSIESFSVFRTVADERSFTEYVPGKGTSNLKYLDPMLQNGRALYGQDTGLVSVRNNKSLVYTYTGTNTLDFVVSPIDGMAANFAVKIASTSETDGTVNVYKKENGIYIPIMPSVAGGNTVEAGKTYQLTCVGDCWTLAEFEEPSVGLKTRIGDKFYSVVKIGSLYWMAENLDYAWDGLIHPTLNDSETDPIANYYGYDGNGSEQPYVGNGLLYNGVAALYLQEHRTELGLGNWRVPTLADWTALITSAGGGSTATQALKSPNGWNAGYDGGTDDLGFGAIGNGGFTAGHTDPVSAFTYMNIGDAAMFLTSTESQDNLLYNVTLWHNEAPQMSYPAPKYIGGALRLCMDVT